MTNLPDFDFGQRLQRLEVSNRRLRAFCMVMLAVFASMFIMGQASSRMLDVERLTIRDRSGVRITLGMETPIQGMPSIPAITMYDEPGKPRLALSVGLSGGASIGLRDESGNWRVFLYQNGARFETNDGKAQMNFGPLGLHLKNLKFHVVEDASSHMSEVSPWRVLVYSPEGRQVSLEDGGVRLRENATVRAVLGRVELRTPSTDVTEQRPPSSLVLFDSAGKVVRAIP